MRRSTAAALRKEMEEPPADWRKNNNVGAKKKRISRVRSTVCDGVSVCVQVQLRKTSGALDIATLPWYPGDSFSVIAVIG